MKFESSLLKFLFNIYLDHFQPPKCEKNRFFLDKLKRALFWLVKISKLLPGGFQRLL